LENELLLYNLQPTVAQVRTTLLVALLLLAAFFTAIAFKSFQLARIDSFIPVFDAILLLGDWVTATLLFVQASVLRSKALIALGTGYFFTGLVIIPHALAFPGAFSPTGLLGAGPNTTVWLYLSWHSGLPASVIAYTFLRGSPDWSHTASLSPRKVIAIGLISATALTGVLTLLATLYEPLLPPLISTVGKWQSDQVFYVSSPVILLIALAMVLTWRERRSALDLWIALVLWAWFLELLLTAFAASRFSFGWYSGRMLGLLSGLFVLLQLLGQTGRLYAQATLQLTARLRERENRYMIRDAIAASIAHELRQPLAAIRLNAQTGQRCDPQPGEIMLPILNEIVGATYRAIDIIESTKALFGKSAAQKRPSNINQLVRDTLVMVSHDLRDLKVSVNLQLHDSLPPIIVNRLQIQQALYNLFMNAAEAMSTMTNRRRMLIVESASCEDGVTIMVGDTGPGIAAAELDRIFDAFYTTKSHGTGLGLSICRSVAEAHGGRLRAAARVPSGVLFEIYLPYNGNTELGA
jgi:signal transduction histidine kinase